MSVSMNLDIGREFEARRESRVDLDKKLQVLKVLEQRVKDFDEAANVFAFGSCMTGWCLKGADLDVVIYFKIPRLLTKEAKYRFLQGLKERWQLQEARGKYSYRLINSSTELVNAGVPLLVLVSQDGIKIDLSVAEDTLKHDGIRNTHLMMCYDKIDDCVAPLVILVKAWAKHHDLVDSRYQRLSSSALALMVIFFLQQKKILPVLQKENPGQFDPNQSVTENTAFDFSRQDWIIRRHASVSKTYNNKHGRDRLADLLVDFFKFYANFSFSSDVISVRTGGTLTRSEVLSTAYALPGFDRRDWYKNFLIEDPFKRTNVACHTYNALVAGNIKAAFRSAATKIDRERSVRCLFGPT